MRALAEDLSRIRPNRTLFVYNTSDRTEVTTYPYIDRTPYGRDGYNDLMCVITDEGKIVIKTMREFMSECVSPRRLSRCSECIGDDSPFLGTPCMWANLEYDPDNDLFAEEWLELLKEQKYPNIGGFKYVSPLYTKTLDELSDPISQKYRYNAPNRHSRSGFVPYLRPPEEHSFKNIATLYERQSEGSKTKAKIKKTIKETCSVCTLKDACDKYRAWVKSKRYVLYCGSFETVTEEQMQKHYLSRISKIDRKDLTFVANHVGDLAWLHGRYKIFLRLRSSDKEGEGLVADIRRKTDPSYNAIVKFLSIKEAVTYLKENLAKYDPFWDQEPVELSDKTAALLMMATDCITTSLRSLRGFSSGRSYSLKMVQPYNWGNRVALSFYMSRGNDAPRWTNLKFEDMFDIFRYYGRQTIPPELNT